MGITFPGESKEYRAARERLLEQEIELRRAMEAVAVARRELPRGGVVPEDYVFPGAGADGNPTDVRLSELFAFGKDSLVIYSFMFPRDPADERPGPASGQTALLKLQEGPCPSCVALLDQLDGAAEHASQHINLAVVAKSPLPRILTFAQERGWRRLRLLSSADNTYNRDYHAESAEGSQRPMLNAFHATAKRSATSGARSSSTHLPTPDRTPATPAPSSRSGTCSTSPPKDAEPIGTSSCATHDPGRPAGPHAAG
jgi:predicted dithiol-disulfide oxidoreductase (DUF899 family)